MKNNGTLVNVGLGMTLGSHITPLSRSYIENADVVFVAASNQLVEDWIASMNTDVRSLQHFYGDGKSRRDTYIEMIDAIMTEVRAGKNVCGAFYGHPGVFAWAPHETIRLAKNEGFKAHMEAGISAEDCLYADLGLDPGSKGCIHYETSQFMYRKKIIDPTTNLVLWQVGLAGDKSLSNFVANQKCTQVLVDLLMETYPADHLVTLYECAVLPIENTRIEHIKLKDLASAELHMKTTMLVPPCKDPEARSDIINKINRIHETQ